MMSSSCRYGSWLAGVILALLASTANAQVQTYSRDATPISYTETDFRLPMPVEKFDSSLGTLLSVTLDLSAGLTSDIAVSNNSARVSNGSVNTRLFAWIADPLGLLSDPAVDDFYNVQPGAFVASIQSTPVSFSLAPGAGVTYTGLTGSNSISLEFSDPGFLSQFVGNAGDEIVLIGATGTNTELAQTGGNTLASQSTSAAMNARVTYRYQEGTVTPQEAIPEPATLGLLALGLISGGGMALRRRTR